MAKLVFELVNVSALPSVPVVGEAIVKTGVALRTLTVTLVLLAPGPYP